MKIIKIHILLLLLGVGGALKSQTPLVKGGKPVGRIVADLQNPTDAQAAKLIQDFVCRMSGATIPIVTPEAKIKKGDLMIGAFLFQQQIIKTDKIKEDGFFLSSANGITQIVGGKGKGTIYGAVTILEEYLDVRYYASSSYHIPISKNVEIPAIEARYDNPDFRFRQTQAYSLKDPVYKLWHRLEEPSEVFAGNYWVHTFDAIVPSAVYGNSHPEYYALINGERRPGWASQWCLTNDDLFELVAQKTDSIFNANPEMKMISISQNDGHDTYCTCDKCMAINDREESLSGSLIMFLNKLATRFPDKEFSTLAYMYSVAPPAHIKPLPNVNIMLCNIECSREVTLAENEAGKKFINDMNGWAKITDNIFVWDYGIDFDNYLSPFPNFHVMQPNMQLFKENKTTMHFSQIGGSKGGDFSELRSYLAAKLLWNTSINTDSLVWEFLTGYYGSGAAPHLYQYIKLREGALMGSKLPLNLYDTPISHKEGMLNQALISRYTLLFEKAEKATTDKDLLLRVKECRLPVQYSELEIAHTNPITDTLALRKKLNHFRVRLNETGVTIRNEQSKLLQDYCDNYEKRYLKNKRINLAKDTKINFIIPPDQPFGTTPEKALTDGVLGTDAPSNEWIGWQNKDAELVIDLGESINIERLEFDFLQRLGSWALLPKSVSWWISDDNKDYTLASHVEIPEDRDHRAKFVTVVAATAEPTVGRYIKVKIETIGLCPPWHWLLVILPGFWWMK